MKLKNNTDKTFTFTGDNSQLKYLFRKQVFCSISTFSVSIKILGRILQEYGDFDIDL